MTRCPYILTAVFTSQALAACECGYSINGTNAQYFGLFANAHETDFLHPQAGGFGTSDWVPQVYNVTAQNAHGEYGKSFQSGNVIPNPMPFGTWNGKAMNVGDPGLQLWVRSGLEDGLVPGAELAATPQDMLYGSFRAGIKMTAINGTCGAFFWYRNDTREIDMEYLSKMPNNISLIVQEPSTDNAMTDGNLHQDTGGYGSIMHLGEGYHDYRFDWMPDRVDFYIDAMLTRRYTEDIPNTPGHLMLSHWSNGNAGWSAGPPIQDAVMTVSYVKAYYNNTSRDVTNEGCTDLGAPGAVCQVQDQGTAPDPTVGNGETPFFMFENDAQSVNPSASHTASTQPTSVSSAADFTQVPSLPFTTLVAWALFGLGLYMMSMGIEVEYL